MLQFMVLEEQEDLSGCQVGGCIHGQSISEFARQFP
jgi:hypothetical protein